MKSIRLADIDLVEWGTERDDSIWSRSAAPLTPGNPGAGEIAAEDCVVVYFELDPGKRLGTHIDSEEEILLVLEGTVTVTVGDDEGTLSAGELAVVPQNEPHDVQNSGDGQAAVIGFFPEGEVTHTATESAVPSEERKAVTKPGTGN